MTPRITLAVIIALTGPNLAAAATITLASNGNPPWIHVLGDFKSGDGELFKTVVGSRTSAIVLLESPGGDARAGVSIGRTIREKTLTTMAWRRCESACAVAWLGGVLRLMFTDTYLGFHAAYRRSDLSESGPANAVVGRYLRELGLSDDAIYFLTEASPRPMKQLKLADARRYGIDLELVPPNSELVLPTIQPQPATATNVAPSPQPAPLPELPTMRTLPTCGSSRVTDTLIRIGNRRGVAVLSIDPYTLTDTADMQLCAADAWTSAGKLAVAYSVTWTDRRLGTYWVQLLRYRRVW